MELLENNSTLCIVLLFCVMVIVIRYWYKIYWPHAIVKRNDCHKLELEYGLTHRSGNSVFSKIILYDNSCNSWPVVIIPPKLILQLYKNGLDGTPIYSSVEPHRIYETNFIKRGMVCD